MKQDIVIKIVLIILLAFGVCAPTTVLAADLLTASITSAPNAPTAPGTKVLLTTTVTGGSGQYEYQIYQKINGSWQVVRPYSTEPGWTWDTTGAAFGTHYFNVYARNTGSKETYETTGFLGYTLQEPPAQSVTTLVTPAAPVVPGIPVNLAFAASGGSGSYEYQVYQKINGSWQVVRPYSTEQGWTWDTTGAALGTHYFNIYARNTGSKETYETTGFLGYTLQEPPAQSVTTLVTPAAPVVPGTPVNLAFAASGGSGSYEYQVYQKINGSWQVVRPYSTEPGWTWDTTGVALGTHYFNIYARNTGSEAVYETTGFLGYTLQGTPAQSVTTLVTPAAPVVPGTPVNLTFAASGGSGSYEYQVYQKINGSWQVVRPYSTEQVWTWDTTGTPLGTHYFNIYARNTGSEALYEATGFLGYTLQGTPAQSVTTQVTPVAPSLPGAPVNLTFAASGGSGSYEYQVYQKINGSWQVVRPYSTEPGWTWDTTGAALGTHYFNIYARNTGSEAVYETTGFLGYTLVPPAAKEVSVTSVPSSPQLTGTSITFTAAASGGSGSYEYQFYRQINGQWTIVQPYSSVSSWTWDTTGVAPGDHYLTVYARNLGSSTLYDTAQFIVYYIITPVQIFSDSNQISLDADSKWGGVEPLNLENWPVARQSIFDNIKGFLGNSPLSVVPLDPQTVSEEDFPDYSRRKVSYEVEPGDRVTAFLLVPKNFTLPRPALLALHQSIPSGKNELVGMEGNDPNQAYAVELVKRGYIVLVPDTMTVGERTIENIDPFNFVPFTQARPYWSASGKILWDHQRGVDYLQSLPAVDSGRIGVIGHSLGATSAMFLAAFDDRIKAVVASCGYARNDIDPNKERWNFYIPQLRPYIQNYLPLPWDMQHLTALIAPRPFFQTFALRDQVFQPVPFSEPLADDFLSLSVTVAQIHKTILPLYLQADKESLLQTWYYDGPHGFPAEMRKAAFDFLDTYLVP